MHGKFGEDGTIQGLLETMGIPYSGCRLLPSAICMNKGLTKRLVKTVGIKTAPWITVKSIEDLEKLFMVWQHATESADSKAQIEVAQEMENEAGFRFSKLTIEGVESDG